MSHSFQGTLRQLRSIASISLATAVLASSASAKSLVQRMNEVNLLTRDIVNADQNVPGSKLENRRAAMWNLLKHNPSKVLRFAVPAKVRQSMPTDAQALIEEEVKDIEGTLATLAQINKDGTEVYLHFIETKEGKKYSLHGIKDPGLLPASGSVVRIKQALRIPNPAEGDGLLPFQANSEQTMEVVEAALPNTYGEQKTMVFMVNFQDQPTNQPYTKDSVRNLVFNDVSNHYYENSFHKTTVAGDVVGYYTAPVSSTASCNTITDTIQSQVPNMARAAGVNLTGYFRYVYVFPNTSTCGWAGLANVGLYGSFSNAWINGAGNSLLVIGHEMGHNLGLYHANAYRCSGGSVGGSCTNLEYRDPADMMGNWTHAHFNAFEKDRMGWLNASGQPGISTVTANGTYTLEPYETYTMNTKALRVLKSNNADGSKDYYYIEARTNNGYDRVIADRLSSMGSNLLSGIIIHQANDRNGNSSHFLDMTPSTDSFVDGALVVGKTFSDPSAPNGGVTITTVSAGISGATVKIAFGNGGTGGGDTGTGGGTPQPCVRSNPTLTVTPAQTQYVTAGQGATYTLSLRNNDSSTCTVSSFSMGVAAQSGITASLNTAVLSIAPGASATNTLQLFSASTTAAGVYSADVSAVNQSSTLNRVSATASLGVQTGTGGGGTGTGGGDTGGTCVKNIPSVVIVPASKTTTGGGTLTYTVNVTNTNTAACGSSTLGLGWGGTSVAVAVPYFSVTLGAGQTTAFNVNVYPRTAIGAGSYRFLVAAWNGEDRTNSSRYGMGYGTYVNQ